MNRRHFLGMLGAGLAGAGCATKRSPGTATTEATYTNPVYARSMPDPGVMLHEGVYYAFGTTGTERKADGRIFTVLRSRDLVHWDELGGALTPPSPDPVYQYWAPEAAYNNGTFYLYYAMGGKEEESFDIHVATSTRPEGPYTDKAILNDCEDNRFTIDAHPFRDDDGQWYLFYARNYPNTEGGFHAGTGLAVDRLVNMTQMAGSCKTILRARHDWTLYEANRRMNVYNNTFDWHTIEAPYVRKRNGKYYLFYSGSNWQSEHYGVDYVVADNVMGPYTSEGNEARILKGIPGQVRGPGHHSIVTGPDGNDWIVYHAWDPQMKVRQMCIDRLYWTDEGPRTVNPTTTPQPAPKAG